MQGPQGPYGHNPHQYHGHAAPMAHPPFQCRACGHVGQAKQAGKTSTAGWILFVVMLCACVTTPFCWVPLLALRDKHLECPRCRAMA